jgi:nicotinate phosphoribosyltransferase
VTSFGSELEAFRSFVREFPEQSVLLIDTYDTLSGARKALEVAREMAAAGRRLRGVRLDSGDLAALSRQVRHIFQNGGFPDIRILASGNLDEFKIEELERNGAAIDVYAVGTRLGVSADAPYLDMVYKLVEYNGRPVLKLSSGKKTWVGAKQVFRHFGSDGCMSEDHLGLASERRAVGQPLLRTVMEGGRRSGAGESLSTIRERFARGYQSLPVSLRELRPGSPYPVKISAPLQRLDEEIVNQRSRAETSPAA